MFSMITFRLSRAEKHNGQPLYPACIPCPILCQPLKRTPHFLIFYTSSHQTLPPIKSLRHSPQIPLLTQASHPPSPLSILGPTFNRCCTNPWPSLFALFCSVLYCPTENNRKLGGTADRDEKKRGGENVSSLFCGQEGSTHIGVWKFHYSFLLFTPLIHFSHTRTSCALLTSHM